MTDGAARLFEVMGVHKDFFDCLTSRDPAKFISSGQWMTEKPGGSDLSNTGMCDCDGCVLTFFCKETIARKIPESQYYSLRGFKVLMFCYSNNIHSNNINSFFSGLLLPLIAVLQFY